MRHRTGVVAAAAAVVMMAGLSGATAASAAPASHSATAISVHQAKGKLPKGCRKLTPAQRKEIDTKGAAATKPGKGIVVGKPGKGHKVIIICRIGKGGPVVGGKGGPCKIATGKGGGKIVVHKGDKATTGKVHGKPGKVCIVHIKGGSGKATAGSAAKAS